MKYKKLVPSKPYETYSRELCDFCGKTIDDRSNINVDDEVEIKAEIGDRWPEEDCRETEQFDCCSRCWRDKVRPALEALGGKVQTYASDLRDRLKNAPMDPEAT